MPDPDAGRVVMYRPPNTLPPLRSPRERAGVVAGRGTEAVSEIAVERCQRSSDELGRRENAPVSRDADIRRVHADEHGNRCQRSGKCGTEASRSHYPNDKSGEKSK